MGCEVKNFTMTEDLGKVNHLFCDKTGTLTKNHLIFRGLAVAKDEFNIKPDLKDKF